MESFFGEISNETKAEWGERCILIIDGVVHSLHVGPYGECHKVARHQRGRGQRRRWGGLGEIVDLTFMKDRSDGGMFNHQRSGKCINELTCFSTGRLRQGEGKRVREGQSRQHLRPLHRLCKLN